VLNAQQNSKFKEIAKQTAASFESAYQNYIIDVGATGSTTTGALTSYLNYVSVDSTSTIDAVQTQTTLSCAASGRLCLKLHNGAMLFYQPAESFGGMATTNSIWFTLDPDGKVTDGTTNGPGKSVSFTIYYSGRVTSNCCLEPNTATGSTSGIQPNAAYDPPWFSWN
jgi:hypothetical protein